MASLDVKHCSRSAVVENEVTVKPVLSDHVRDPGIVVADDRWSLSKESLAPPDDVTLACQTLSTELSKCSYNASCCLAHRVLLYISCTYT